MFKLVIPAIVLVVVLVAAFQMLPDAGHDPDEWEYDDYRQDAEAVAASGSLEIVEAGDIRYVHAKAVGRGSIEYPDRTVDVTVNRAYLDVYLMLGQSNAGYFRVDPSKAAPLPAPGEAYAFMASDGGYGRGGSYSETDFAMRPIVSPEGVAQTGDKAPSFCAAVTQATGHKAYWVCGAWGGQSVTIFTPASSGWVYFQGVIDRAMSQVDEELYIVNTVCYMWIQGEHDKDMPVQDYKGYFLRMHEAILSGDLGYEFGHCFISLPNINDGGNSVEAQMQLAEEHPGTITIASDAASSFTQANGLMSSDDVHYTQRGDNIIGSELGECVGSHYPASVDAWAKAVRLVPLLLAVGALAVIAFAIIVRR